jgi:hypothetical protein
LTRCPRNVSCGTPKIHLLGFIATPVAWNRWSVKRTWLTCSASVLDVINTSFM